MRLHGLPVSDREHRCWLQTQLGRQLDEHNIIAAENEMQAFGNSQQTVDSIAGDIVTALVAWLGESPPSFSNVMRSHSLSVYVTAYQKALTYPKIFQDME